MPEKKRLQVPLSTLCPIIAVVALTISLFLSTFRHNAQLAEQERRHSDQLVEQAERFGIQLQEMTSRHNAQMEAGKEPSQGKKPTGEGAR